MLRRCSYLAAAALLLLPLGAPLGGSDGSDGSDDISSNASTSVPSTPRTLSSLYVSDLDGNNDSVSDMSELIWDLERVMSEDSESSDYDYD